MNNSSALKTVPGGKVIMFDGVDGVGKTTQIELITKELVDGGWLVKTSRINGGTPIGEELRNIMLSGTARPGETDLYIAMAMYSALAVQLEEWRSANALILVDRSPLSIVAYQSYGEKVPMTLAEPCLDRALELLSPDLIMVYDLDVVEALKRDKHKIDSDYFTSHGQQFFDDVRSGYLYAAEKHQPLVKLMDINGLEIKQIADKTLEAIDSVRANASPGN